MPWETTQAFTDRYSDPAGAPKHEEQCDLARRAQNELRVQRELGRPIDMPARNEMVRRNLGLVYDRVDKIRWRAAASSIADLEQEGVLGLMVAVEHFNPDAGYRFSTYARWWIDGYLRRYLLDHPDHAPLRVPVHMMHLHNQSARMTDDERQAAEEANPMLADARRALAFPLPIRRGGMDGETFGDLVDPSAPLPEAAEEYREEHAKLHASVAMLDERRALIIRRRHGLDGSQPAYLREVAAELGCSLEIVRRQEHQAIKQLRAVLDPEFDDTETPGRAGASPDIGRAFSKGGSDGDREAHEAAAHRPANYRAKEDRPDSGVARPRR